MTTEQCETLKATETDALQQTEENHAERLRYLEHLLAEVTAQNRRLHAELEAMRGSLGWRLLERAYRLRRSPVLDNCVVSPVLRLARSAVRAYVDGGVREVLRRGRSQRARSRPTESGKPMGTVERLKSSLQPVTCDLCHADSISPLRPNQSPPLVVRCNGCGLIYFNPQPTEEALREYYNSEAQDAYTPRLCEWQGELTPQKIQRLTDDLNALEQWLLKSETRNPPVRFLEVGCAFGHQLYCAKVKGWEVVGVELSAPAAAWVTQELGLDVVNGTVEDAATALPEEGFDLILMSHVLEHVTHPTSAVRAAFHLLKPGGVVAIYVPNGEGLQARHDFDQWEWTCFPEHLYYFSPPTLTRLLTKCGFQVEHTWTCVGHSNAQPLLELIQRRLYLNSSAQAERVAEVLGPMGLLSDLRVVARKPSAQGRPCYENMDENIHQKGTG